jgi:uncharacterized protein (TIGR02996 family)
MTHDEAFLKAIAENPDDDAPRLIYADWLEEHGGAAEAARAAFIRAQCRLAQMPLQDPARPALQDECGDLLAEHENEWTASVRGVAERWEFRRGFIEQIEIRDGMFLKHAEALMSRLPLRAAAFRVQEKSSRSLAACPQLSRLETIEVRHQRLGDSALRPLLTSPHLNHLTALNLSGNAIEAPTVAGLLEGTIAPRLQRLDLSRNDRLGDRAVGTLVNSPRLSNLQALYLGRTNITAAGLQEVFAARSLRRLLVLHLPCSCYHFGRPFAARYLMRMDAFFGGRYPGERNEGVPAAVLDNLAGSPLLPRLVSLDLSGWVHQQAWPGLLSVLQRTRLSALYLQQCGLTQRETDLLAELPQLSSLTTLDLSMNGLKAKDFLPLAQSPHLANLTTLDLGFNILHEEGAQMIASAPSLRRLTLLILRDNLIGDGGVTALAASPNLQNLRWLNLAVNFLHHAASIRVLARSPHLKHLIMLDLGNSRLGPDSAQALAHESQLGRLEQLYLDSNQLGDEGAAVLAASPTLGRLKLFNLRDNGLGPAGAEALAGSRSLGRLRNLDVRENNVTGKAAELLRKRFGTAVLVEGSA